MISKKLAEIQQKLKAPKGQVNKFGGYKYRSCEDILEAVKPLLGDLILTVSDDITLVGNRVYVKATATVSDGEHSISTTALAREAETKKGMDEAQITGSASSYARKYALNGLLCIDDTKDADSTNDHGKQVKSIDGDQAAIIYDLIEKTNTDIEKFLKAFNISCVEELGEGSFDKAFNMLQRKLSNEGK